MGNADRATLAFVTGNGAKFLSYCAMLGLNNLEWKEAATPKLPDSLITKEAEAKMQYARKNIRHFPFFVEQSGLFIDGWNGLPGGLSEIFIDMLTSKVICRMMMDFKDAERTANIRSIIYYVRSPKARLERYEGTLKGSISMEPRGDEGFGWDPIFIPENYTQTFAELGPTKKQQILADINPVAKFRHDLLVAMNEYSQHQESDRNKKGPPNIYIDTRGGAYIAGNVTPAGDFVGRDRTEADSSSNQPGTS